MAYSGRKADTDAEEELVLEDIADDAEEEEADENAGDDDVSGDQITELQNRYTRLFAEYENFRKRTAKERDLLYADAVAEVSGLWLSVLDNVDRAIETGHDISDGNPEKFVQGIEMIGRQARDVIAKIGITEIECERGTEFDPEYHEAVMHIEDESLGEQTVASVFRKGYIYKKRVIRHAVVQVAN